MFDLSFYIDVKLFARAQMYKANYLHSISLSGILYRIRRVIFPNLKKCWLYMVFFGLEIKKVLLLCNQGNLLQGFITVKESRSLKS